MLALGFVGPLAWCRIVTGEAPGEDSREKLQTSTSQYGYSGDVKSRFGNPFAPATTKRDGNVHLRLRYVQVRSRSMV